MPGSRKRITDVERALLRIIGEILKDLREQSGLTQSQAAKSVGMAQSRLPVLENGQADLMLTTLNRWANAYGHCVEISFVPLNPVEEEVA